MWPGEQYLDARNSPWDQIKRRPLDKEAVRSSDASSARESLLPTCQATTKLTSIRVSLNSRCVELRREELSSSSPYVRK